MKGTSGFFDVSEIPLTAMRQPTSRLHCAVLDLVWCGLAVTKRTVSFWVMCRCYRTARSISLRKWGNKKCVVILCRDSCGCLGPEGHEFGNFLFLFFAILRLGNNAFERILVLGLEWTHRVTRTTWDSRSVIVWITKFRRFEGICQELHFIGSVKSQPIAGASMPTNPLNTEWSRHFDP